MPFLYERGVGKNVNLELGTAVQRHQKMERYRKILLRARHYLAGTNASERVWNGGREFYRPVSRRV